MGGWDLQEVGGGELGEWGGLLLRLCSCVLRAGDLEEGRSDGSELSEVVL